MLRQSYQKSYSDAILTGATYSIIFYHSKLVMTTMSKNYGFPTGYFSLIYNYLCDNGKLDRDNDK